MANDSDDYNALIIFFVFLIAAILISICKKYIGADDISNNNIIEDYHRRIEQIRINAEVPPKYEDIIQENSDTPPDY